MKSYFFIPANNKKFLEKISDIGSNEIILELEDGIPSNDIHLAISLIKDINAKENLWIRPRIDFIIDNRTLLEHLLDLGFKKIILPKICGKTQFDEVAKTIKQYQGLKIILLVEYPRLLLELENVLKDYKVYGLAFGMHDFAREFGVKPNYSVFSHYTKQILLISKAYGVKYIDSPSMKLSDGSRDQFEEELLDLKKIGADGKFIIHPRQLEWFNKFSLYTEEEINWAKNISNQTNIYGETNDHATFVIDGEIVEKPHIELAIKILEWHEKSN
jgi:citrate lyase beta subunit